MSVYRHISAKKPEVGFPVSVMCELLEVSSSGYYEWAGARRLTGRSATHG